ncbi:glycosyltransferase family 2 protein [Chitinibacter sp. FCG-7]|uniref:Glycosyltransferase family 2 protein n=1 Tax=Chitinibacter mangrovi TaxID=3153927 RepID=A0AAU7F6R8_9NEIS
MVKFSVIIPTYNRVDLTQRAVDSVLSCPGSEYSEVIVIDDCSSDSYQSLNLRKHDKYFRLKSNQGAAFCRNYGMDLAVGEVIYLLDSDDYFIFRDFQEDYNFILNSDASAFYCDMKSGASCSKFPNNVDHSNFLDFTLNRHEGIANTCTLVFLSARKFRFTSGLPRHQDWDFLYRNIFKKGGQLKKLGGFVFIDRSDKKSISRAGTPEKSYIWLDYMQNELSADQYCNLRYHVLSHFCSEYSWPSFFKLGFRLVLQRRLSVFKFIKRFVQRFL